jgi:hypothetical protein
MPCTLAFGACWTAERPLTRILELWSILALAVFTLLQRWLFVTGDAIGACHATNGGGSGWIV